MHRSKKLIRLGLWLVPWLPAFLLAVFVYAAYFAPKVYVPYAKMGLNPDGTSFFTLVEPPERHFTSLHVTPALVVLVCTLCAFVAGCVLLLVGFLRRSKPPADPHPDA